jgi:hypothetical protein
VIALVRFVVLTVAEEDTLFGTEREFMRVIGAKIREACTPKDFKESVVRSVVKKFLKWRLIFLAMEWAIY